MYGALLATGVICAVFAGVFLITSISMFFGFNIPALRKDVSGILEEKQIEEIRRKSSEAEKRRGKINVFEELEKKAKVGRRITTSHVVGKPINTNAGTTILSKRSKPFNPRFIIEKDITFVSTNEVL